MTMFRPRAVLTTLIVVTFAVTGCGAGPALDTPAPATPVGSAAVVPPSDGPSVGQAVTPVHLRFADPDDKDRPSQPAIDEFLRVVDEASGGAMTVEMLYGAGGTTASGRDGIVTNKVTAGDVELAIAPVRAWSDTDATSVLALGAPLLIDSDALMTAVAKDPLVQPMLDGMADAGLVGLAVWPEDLRHPFGWDSTGGPLLTAADFSGTNVWTLPSSLQGEVMRALGATAVYDEFPDKLVAAGTIRGAESGLETGAFALGGFPTATGDVTLYPKYQILVAEDAAWSRLTPAQQDVIRKAAAAATDAAVTSHKSDNDLALAYCEATGKVVLAGPENVATFVRAVQPVIDRMSKDPVTASAIKAIQALKSSIGPKTGAVACTPPISAVATQVPVEAGPPTTLVPEGVYRYGQTREQLLARGLNDINSGNNAGTWTLRLSGGTGTWELDHDNGSGKEVCNLTFKVLVDRVRLKCADHPDEFYDFRWTLSGDALTLHFVDTFTGLEYDRAGSEVIFGGPWTKVE